MRKELEKLVEDPVLFAELLLGLKPFDYQRRLLSDKSKRIVACMGRQTGKTTTIAAKAIHFAYTHPNTTTLIVSPSLRQSMIMFDRILSFIHRSPLLVKSIIRKTRTIIQLSNGSQIIALPCSEHLLRGYTASLVIVDEANFTPERVITQIIFPMLSTTGGSIIFLSTPWDKNHFFYKAFMNPNYSVHRVKSSECPLITPEFLAEMRQNMTHEAYLMEYEAEFVESASSYFPMELIRNCVDASLEFTDTIDDISASGPLYLGCDLGKLKDYSVIAIVQKSGDVIQLLYLQEFPLGTPYPAIIGAIVRACKKLNIIRGLVDKSGPGETVLDELRRQELHNIKAASFTIQKKAEYLTFLKLKMEQGKFKMPYSRRLCQQINEQRYEYTKSGQIRFWHPENSHDDMLWALALSVYSTKESEGKVFGAAVPT